MHLAVFHSPINCARADIRQRGGLIRRQHLHFPAAVFAPLSDFGAAAVHHKQALAIDVDFDSALRDSRSFLARMKAAASTADGTDYYCGYLSLAITFARRHNRIRFYEFGPFRLDVAERQLWRDGDEITVTPKAFGVLLTLVRNHGHVVEKDTFMSEVWAESFVEEKNLTDGQSIFYNKYGYFAMGLFRRVLDQATETRVLNLPQTDSFGDWMVTGEGI